MRGGRKERTGQTRGHERWSAPSKNGIIGGTGGLREGAKQGLATAAALPRGGGGVSSEGGASMEWAAAAAAAAHCAERPTPGPGLLRMADLQKARRADSSV